jgi:hypothetical protein
LYIPIFLWMRRLRLMIILIGSLHCLNLPSLWQWVWWATTLPQLAQDLCWPSRASSSAQYPGSCGKGRIPRVPA